MTVDFVDILTQAIQRLQADAGILAITGEIVLADGTPTGLAKVFNHIPQDEVLPFVHCRYTQGTNYSTKQDQGQRGVLRIQAHTDQHGDLQVLQLANLVNQALQNQPLSLTNQQNVCLYLRSLDTPQVSDGVAHTCILLFDTITTTG